MATWYGWIDRANTTASTSTANTWLVPTTQTVPWNIFVSGTDNASVTASGTVWVSWNSGTSTAPYTTFAPDPWPPPLPDIYEEEAREHADAERRAEALLLEHLTPEQRETWDREQYIPVVSHDGARHYRIFRGRARNIRLVDADGKEILTYCAHPVEKVPVADCLLAQKLMLEMAEHEFLRIANVS